MTHSVDANRRIADQVGFALLLFNSSKPIYDYHISQIGRLPESNSEIGMAEPEETRSIFFSSIEVHSGDVVYTFAGPSEVIASELQGRQLRFVASIGESGIDWLYLSDDIDPKFLPPHCQVGDTAQ